MFLRSFLQRKHKKDHDGAVPKSTHGDRKQRETVANDADEVREVVLQHQSSTTDCNDTNKDEPRDSTDSNIPSLNTLHATEGKDSQSKENDEPAPPIPPLPPAPPQREEPEELVTSTSGLDGEKSQTKQPVKVFVGQQGDGTFKGVLVNGSEVAYGTAEESNSEDEGFSGSDSQIEELIKDVIATVSLELQREYFLTDEAASAMGGQIEGTGEKSITNKIGASRSLPQLDGDRVITEKRDDTRTQRLATVASNNSRSDQIEAIYPTTGPDVNVDDKDKGIETALTGDIHFPSNGNSASADDRREESFGPHGDPTDNSSQAPANDDATFTPVITSSGVTVRTSRSGEALKEFGSLEKDSSNLDVYQLSQANNLESLADITETSNNSKRILRQSVASCDVRGTVEVGDYANIASNLHANQAIDHLKDSVGNAACISDDAALPGGNDVGTPMIQGEDTVGNNNRDELQEHTSSSFEHLTSGFRKDKFATSGGGTETQSKGRSSSVLACRFYMDNESEQYHNATSSPVQTVREGIGAFYHDYHDGRDTRDDFVMVGRGPEITPIRYVNGARKYHPQGLHENYSLTDSENTDEFSSAGACGNRDWSKIEDVTDSFPYGLDNFETSDNYDVFIPRPSLDDFVITPCDDSDSDEGEELAQEHIPSSVAKETVKITTKLNPVAKEWIQGDQYQMPVKKTELDLGNIGINMPSPTEEEATSERLSAEEKRQDLDDWEKFREVQMERGMRSLLWKLESRVDSLPEHLRGRIDEFRSKLANTIDLGRPMELMGSKEDEGEISLMDKRVLAVMEQQASLALSLKNTEERTRIMETQLEQFQVGEEERKKQVVSLREEVEDATARQRSLTVMLNEERRLKEALQLRLATMTQEKQQLLYNNVMLWEQTSQLELKQEQFQGVSDQERRELEDQMKALEAELIELRSRKAGEPVKKISIESACSAPSDQNLTPGALAPNGEAVGTEAEQGDYEAPPHGRYGPPPPEHDEGEYYPPPYPHYRGPFRHNANNSGYPFPPRGRGRPPVFFRRGYPRRRGDNLTVYFDHLSKVSPMTWYPSNSQDGYQSSPRGGRRPFRGRGRGYGRGRRGRFHREETRN